MHNVDSLIVTKCVNTLTDYPACCFHGVRLPQLARKVTEERNKRAAFLADSRRSLSKKKSTAKPFLIGPPQRRKILG